MVITYLVNLKNNKNVKYYIIGFNLMIRYNFKKIKKWIYIRMDMEVEMV